MCKGNLSRVSLARSVIGRASAALIFAKQKSADSKNKTTLSGGFIFGACGRIRTGDLLITSELLCQLSHTSREMTLGTIPHFVSRVKTLCY